MAANRGIIKVCSCGTAYACEAWQLLQYVGLQQDPRAELRNCAVCGSTIGVEIPGDGAGAGGDEDDPSGSHSAASAGPAAISQSDSDDAPSSSSSHPGAGASQPHSRTSGASAPSFPRRVYGRGVREYEVRASSGIDSDGSDYLEHLVVDSVASKVPWAVIQDARVEIHADDPEALDELAAEIRRAAQNLRVAQAQDEDAEVDHAAE